MALPLATPWEGIHVRLKFAQIIPHIRDIAKNLPREGWVAKRASISRIKGQTSILRGRAKGKRLEGKAEVLQGKEVNCDKRANAFETQGKCASLARRGHSRVTW